ncbi:MAG: DNA primase [Candidatus Atribacteria bacterium]|nr:DNA primase [Candidatus Atribacteria bacterium]
MVRYSDETLDEIRNRLDIVALVSEYVSLKKSGKSYKGLCPFHQEKTPSFLVDVERQIFHCFGCGEGGNIFTFIMKMERLNFPEAVRMLARKAGVALPVSEKRNIKDVQERELIYRCNEIAADYYQKKLFSIQGKRALQYLLERSFTKEIIKTFHLGYALPGYENLINALLSQKIAQSDLFKAGLVAKSSRSNQVIDYFRDRIIFPIFNLQGKIIAFGGRVLDDKLPKYLNSPETPVYHKAKNLYGFFQAKRGIRQKNQAIIMEGYTDVLMAHQYGFENTVASLGTALTEQQVDLIKRFADEIIISFDADTAGKSAALRSLGIIKKAGITVRVISLPDNSDPASILLQKGKIFFSNLIDNALTLIDYKLEVMMKQYNPATSVGKISIVRELFQDLSAMNSEIELHSSVKKIAEKLKLNEESILKDLHQYKRGKSKPSNIATNSRAESTHVNAEKILIGSMLQKKEGLERVVSELEIEDFSVTEHQAIVAIIIDLFEKGEKISLQKVIDQIEKPEIINLLSQIMLKDIVSLDSAALERSIRAIKTHKLKRELDQVKGRIVKEEKGNREVNPELLLKYQNILEKIKKMA